jgi:macrodomain Ter protein organizer (MatP/YcbG family)
MPVDAKYEIQKDDKGFFYIYYDKKNHRCKTRVLKSECPTCHNVMYQNIRHGKGVQKYCSHNCQPHPNGYKKDKSTLNMKGLELGRAWNKGLKNHLSEEVKQKMSLAHIGKRKKIIKSGNRAERKRIIGRIEYKLWRNAVFERDQYICQKCEKKGCYLNAHHKKTFKDYPELRTCIDNGITLCLECHRNEHRRMKLKVVA